MIGLKAPKRFLESIYSLPGGIKPLGVLFVAPPGAGKSYLLTKILSPGSIVINDITGWGLERIVSEIYMKDTYPYIVIPDFVKVASRKQSYESFLGLMNALLEEGVSQIRKYDLEVKFEKPVRCGILTGITPDYLEKRVKLIKETGYGTRQLIFKFNYRKSDIERIEEKLTKGIEDETVIINAGKAEIEIRISEEAEEGIIKVARLIAMSRGDHTTFRAINQVRTLATGFANYRNSPVVEKEDIKEVASLVPFLISHQGTGSDDLEFAIIREKLKLDPIVNIKDYTQQEIRSALFDLLKKKILVKQFDSYVLNF